MRKSHYIFFGFCIAWVSFIVATSPKEIIDEIGYPRALGQAIGSLVIPGLIYGGYLLLTRKKTKA